MSSISPVSGGSPYQPPSSTQSSSGSGDDTKTGGSHQTGQKHKAHGHHDKKEATQAQGGAPASPTNQSTTPAFGGLSTQA